MSRHDAAPTHGWVIGSKVNKWLALAFVLSTLLFFIGFWTIRYSIDRDCTDVYKRDVKVFHYWIHLESGSTKKECPQYGR